MTNRLLKVLLSLLLTLILFQGYNRQSPVLYQHSICFAQPASDHKSVITKVQAEDKRAQTETSVSSHKKDRCHQKVLVADNDDDDDNDDVISAKRYVTDNCFFSDHLLLTNPFYFTKHRLAPCPYFSVLSTGKHLLLCTLRI